MPTGLGTNYLDPQTLAAIGSVELRSRMIAEGLMTGMHRSPMQGFSVEFAQHRPYTPGDDTRFLDWKVYGKTDKLYLKQYQRETNLDMLLLVDASGSMAYGSWSAPGAGAPWRKFDHAASLAVAMAHLALRQQDRVGLTLFDRGLGRSARLSNSRGHWRSIVETLAAAELPDASRPVGLAEDDAGRTELGRVIDRVNARLTQRSLVVLISDLFDDPDALEQGLAKLHHRRHDVILLQVLDPAERRFPFRAASEFIGLEGEGRLPLEPRALRQAYLDVLEAHLGRVEAAARKYMLDYLLLNTSRPLGPGLNRFLAGRSAMLARG